jgi:serine/threonine protein kinase
MADGVTQSVFPPTTSPETIPEATPRTENVSVPGYEILGELGRGGMGVVYRARQVKLDRLVALKMILAAGHAGEAHLARFRTEGEAIARLQHPNIVQVHEVGEQGGLPYFTLEYCSGGTLKDRLNGTPLPPQDAAMLVGTLARAVDVAHRHNIIHRDLKPANVLLTDDGTPKITDFGLAKKLDDDSGQTQSGAVMGTPSYMAPEQAGGQGKQLGPATDIYALGAILYECLTGRPPFKAATIIDTLQQVVVDEPVPPTQLQSRTPRDLETICLKCLRKESGRRYESAAALADDLRRFVEGRPILARPVGQLERMTKWVRRNRILAGMSAALILALLLGTAGSLGFGIEANKKAELAKKNEDDATTKGDKLAIANEDLDRSRQRLERTLARSLLRPLGAPIQPNQPIPPLNDQEIESLWELASSREDQFCVLFVEEGLQRPLARRQLRARGAVALHAAVGLNENRRKQVEDVLRKRLQTSGITKDEQSDVAIMLADLGGLDPALAVQVGATLLSNLSPTMDFPASQVSAQYLSTVASRMEAKDGAELLVAAMKQVTYPAVVHILLDRLAVLANRLEAKEAERICTPLAAIIASLMLNPRNDQQAAILAPGLAAITPQMDARESARVFSNALGKSPGPAASVVLREVLTAVVLRMDGLEAVALLGQAMGQSSNGISLSPVLEAMARQLDGKAAGQAAESLTRTMNQTANPVALSELARGLIAVAVRMEPGEGAAKLAWAMTKTSDARVLRSLAESLSLVAAKMEPKEAALVCDQAAGTLSDAMNKVPNPMSVASLSQGISVLIPRMEPKPGALVCSHAVDALSKAMTRTGAFPELEALSQALSSLAASMEPKEAATILKRTMNTTTQTNALYWLAIGLSAVAARMEPMDAVATLAEVHSKTADSHVLRTLSDLLAAEAARLEPKDSAVVCAQAAATVTLAMSKTTDPRALVSLSQGLSALALRMEAKEAVVVCSQAAEILLQTLGKIVDPNGWSWFLQGLSPLTVRMEPKEAATKFLECMNKPTFQRYLGALAELVSLAADRMEPRDANTIRTQAAAILTKAMSDPRHPSPRQNIAVALTRLTASMERKEAIAILTPVLNKPGDPESERPLMEALGKVAGRMEPMEGAAVLIPLIARTKSLTTSEALTRDFSVPASRLTPDEARRVVAMLRDTKGKTENAENGWASSALSVCISAVAARMEPSERAATLAEEFAALAEAPFKPQPRPFDMTALHAVADRMEAKEAVASLSGVLDKIHDPFLSTSLAVELKAAADRLEPKDASAAYRRVARTLLEALNTPIGVNPVLNRPESLTQTIAQMDEKDASAICRLAADLLLDSLRQRYDAVTVLQAILSREIWQTTHRRPAAVAEAVSGLAGTGTPFGALGSIAPALEPIPPPLPAQTLVDLLKHPLCVGEARRLVLEQLARHYHRDFADQWEFVKYVREQNIGLDLTTPPEKPDLAAAIPPLKP